MNKWKKHMPDKYTGYLSLGLFLLTGVFILACVATGNL